MVAASVICVRAADTLDQVRRSAVQDEKVTAFSENGAKVTLEARRSWLGVTHAGGSTQGAELLVLFDRRAGSFWWGLNYLPGASSAALVGSLCSRGYWRCGNAATTRKILTMRSVRRYIWRGHGQLRI